MFVDRNKNIITENNSRIMNNENINKNIDKDLLHKYDKRNILNIDNKKEIKEKNKDNSENSCKIENKVIDIENKQMNIEFKNSVSIDIKNNDAKINKFEEITDSEIYPNKNKISVLDTDKITLK